MESHWKALERLIPGLAEKDILDLGSGRGAFLVEAARRGARAKGVECYDAYIQESKKRAEDAGVSVDVAQGYAEQVPYPDDSFDFINIGEVIEHVEDPGRMLEEVRRVLRPEGVAYVSVPNRFGMRDPHFKLYFVNWLPRALANPYISLFGRHKDYTDVSAGLQRLTDMHYYTFPEAKKLFARHGFSATDIRAHRIANEFTGIKRTLAALLYPLARSIYFDSAHVLVSSRS